MSMRRVFLSLAMAASASFVSVPACAQQADFNEVGKNMAIMLVNSHFARLPFNEALSQRFLEDYLDDLDGARMYFTQKDVDGFRKSYANRLNAMIIQGECMRPATEIYEVFRKRVVSRIGYAQELLEKNHFDFTADTSVLRSRKDAPWPVDEEAARELWRLHITEAVLSETLRLETIGRLAKEQGKENPLKGDRSPTQKVALRYERLLHTVTDVDEEDIANYFLSAVARSYDPHTDYMSYREMSRFSAGMKNELVGIGALLQAEEDGATKIMGIVVNGPADRQGELKLNDRIVGVDSLNTEKPGDMIDIMFMPIDKVVDLIRGDVNTEVRLKVEPAGGPAGKTKFIVIRRERVELKDEQVSAEIIQMPGDDGSTHRLAWLTIPSFYADFDKGETRVSVDVEKLLESLIKSGIDGIVLDLRNNGGGSLEEVRRMTGFFIPRGPVVQVKNTLGQIQVKNSSNRRPLYGGPLVVVTDRTSASASEILAGALQDYNRAVLVGDSSTFGKGTVQQPMDIGRMLPVLSARERAGYLKVTIQKFYRPSGSSTQLEGVKPDIVLPSILDALEIGEEYLDHPLRHDRIRKARDFRAYRKENLFLPRLEQQSRERVKQSQDFSYTVEDMIRTKAQIRENRVLLNKEGREKKIAEAEQRQKTRNAERRERFAKIEVEDRKKLKFFRLTLDDIENDRPPQVFDPYKEDDRYMRRAKDKTEELNDTPKWPSRMDPVKRESLHILRDLSEVTKAASMAGMLKKADAR
jgi:carboxyl-terminal processing protease